MTMQVLRVAAGSKKYCGWADCVGRNAGTECKFMCGYREVGCEHDSGACSTFETHGTVPTQQILYMINHYKFPTSPSQFMFTSDNSSAFKMLMRPVLKICLFRISQQLKSSCGREVIIIFFSAML